MVQIPDADYEKLKLVKDRLKEIMERCNESAEIWEIANMALADMEKILKRR